MATIGVAVFTVAVVAGQTVSSLLVDRVGVGPAASSRSPHDGPLVQASRWGL